MVEKINNNIYSFNIHTSYLIRLKGHDHNVSAYSRRSVNAWGVVNFASTVCTYYPGNLNTTPRLSSIIIVYAVSIRKNARARRHDRAPLTPIIQTGL